MRTLTILGAILVFSPLSVAAQKVFVDYDQATAFSEYKTFQYRETKEDLRDFSRTSHELVLESLKRYASDGGLREVSEDPDIYIAYYTADRGSLRLTFSDLEYAYGDGFDLGAYWEGGVGTRTPDSFSFREGTLVVDVWEAAGQRLVWRAIATAVLSSDPDKNDKKIEKALRRIMKRWEEAKGGHVRAVRKLKAEQGD